ncbi:hypothetical protein T09_10794 [Trichinella sp. T9]|nr:hypothetical protein T09_10794 [Trichinella sp. T9]
MSSGMPLNICSRELTSASRELTTGNFFRPKSYALY